MFRGRSDLPGIFSGLVHPVVLYHDAQGSEERERDGHPGLPDPGAVDQPGGQTEPHGPAASVTLRRVEAASPRPPIRRLEPAQSERCPGGHFPSLRPLVKPGSFYPTCKYLYPPWCRKENNGFFTVINLYIVGLVNYVLYTSQLRIKMYVLHLFYRCVVV